MGQAGTSLHQSGNKLTEEGFAPAAGVVDEFEEGEVQRQLLLRDAPVWAKPGAQEGPNPLHGVDVDLAEAIAIIITGVFTVCVADRGCW